MKNRIILIGISILGLYLAGCQQTTTNISRKTTNFNQDWWFAKDLPDTNYYLPKASTEAFTVVNLPHTPKIEPLVVNDQWMGTCWYRKTFVIPSSEKRQIHQLYFEGVMQNATIYLNGKHIGQHTGGYLPFTIPISKYLKYNKPNVLAIKLVNTDDTLVPPGKPLNVLDFNRYGGIYRNVKLITTSKLHITDAIAAEKPASGGVFVSFNHVDSTKASMTVKTEFHNEYIEEKQVEVVHILSDASGKQLVFSVSESQQVGAHQIMQSTIGVDLENPILWSPENPYLYVLKTQLLNQGQVVDQITQKIGMRDVQLTEEGLFLNGKKIFLSGTNRHQEYPYVGYALSDEAQWRDAVKIKNAGFNMVRLSHYPQSEAFMDACDALGIVTMNCIPGWQYNGNETFKQHVLKDVRELIRRDRNRTSVFFWELSLNESWMLPDFMDRILAVKDEEFPDNKPITCAWIDYEGYDLFIPARQHGKPPYYWNNYKEGKRPVFIAEYGDWEYYAQNAGFNQTAYADLKENERTSRQLRGDGERRLLQQALNYQEATNSNRKGIDKGTIGQANWLMFDYNRGYTNDLESSGVADIFRIPKFAYYFYRSQRNADEPVAAPAQGGPMVYIASYWTDESPLDIRIFSNAETVELFLNGKSLGKQKPDNDHYCSNLKHPPFTFHVKTFQAGTLKAIAYNNRQVVAVNEVSTPEKPEALSIKIDSSSIAINRKNDLVFVYASVTDKIGTICPTDTSAIEFNIEGAQLVGENPVKAEAGIASILVKLENSTNNIRVSTNAAGLKEANIEF